MADDLAVLARTGLGFIGVDDEEVGTLSRRALGMKLHFIPVGKPCPAAPAQAGRLDALDDLVGTDIEQLLRPSQSPRFFASARSMAGSRRGW
jgi:hypothetical protein